MLQPIPGERKKHRVTKGDNPASLAARLEYLTSVRFPTGQRSGPEKPTHGTRNTAKEKRRSGGSPGAGRRACAGLPAPGESHKQAQARLTKPEATVAGVLGVGLDGDDGHKRVTRTEEMVLVGGSAETNERMQETAIRLAEALEKRSTRLQDTHAQE